jgi:ribosomal protein L29
MMAKIIPWILLIGALGVIVKQDFLLKDRSIAIESLIAQHAEYKTEIKELKAQLAEARITSDTHLSTLLSESERLASCRKDVAAAQLLSTPCPSNCAGLDCRELRAALVGYEACVDFVETTKKAMAK